MADFQTSTHRARWIFKPHDLVEKHRATNERAIRTLEQYGATRLEVDIDGSISYPEPQVSSRENGNQGHNLPESLTIEEEQLIHIFYEQKIQEVCGAFGFPHKIQVEEFHVSAEELGKGIQQDHQVILNNEMIVLQSLGFDLIAYAPYRSVDGFLDDMEGFFQVKNSQQMFKELRDATILEIDKTMLTDAPLLFPPGQLALAALRRSNNTLNILDFDRYLHNICSQRHEHAVYEMEDSICAIESLVNEAKIPAAKDMRHIDRKLKCCWNPSLQEDSRKREKKSKHKSKRTLTEMRAPQM